jgi:glycosyltransferase involved in cell wall biosynthesis/SAM-dependent methyltransferase
VTVRKRPSRTTAKVATKLCTIIAQNYLAQARVLANSVSTHHKGERLQVLVIDVEPATDYSTEPFDLISPVELGLPQDEFQKMAAMYEVTELATAVKPWLLGLLLERGAMAVVYLDPDTELYSDLSQLGALAVANDIVLIPHTLRPIPEDGLRPTPTDVSQSGVYNLGFLAVGAGARPFLDWWSTRLSRDCVVAPEEGLFVDQRLMDFVPGYFRHHVHRDAGYNVAYWNLHERSVSWTGQGYEVAGEPLRFFHFSGYDARFPDQLSKHQEPNPRTRLAEQPDLARLCSEYGDRLLAAGYLEAIARPYALGRSASGLPLDRRVRRLYRSALIASERDAATPPPPDPFALTRADEFTEWLQEPAVSSAPSLSRYLYALYRERLDLQTAFPDIRGPDLDRYLDWVAIDGRSDPPIPSVFLPDPKRLSTSAAIETVAVRGEGVNVVGYVHAELGVGEAARLLLNSISAAGIPHSVVPYSTQWSRQRAEFDASNANDPIYDVNLICINADQLPAFTESAGRRIRDGRYQIGYWWWEVDEFPAAMAAAADLVDEVWVGSAHTARAVSRAVAKPVIVVPLPIVAPPASSLTRSELGLSQGFLFLFSFDFHSVFERKNPLGLVQAYRRAFASASEACLVIKTINGDAHPNELRTLRASADGRPDIQIVDGYMSSDELHGLTHQADAYVSLHRAEGHGLTLAEAMAVGKPVIATGYSGNLEYMTDRNSYLVPYALVDIPPGCDPYPVTARWAEPDLDAAAAIFHRVIEDSREAQEKMRQARADIEQFHSPALRGNLISERLKVVRRLAKRAPPVAIQVPETSGEEAAPSVSARYLAASRLAAGPRLGSPHALARLVQRMLLRVLNPLGIHLRETSGAILDALGEAESRWWKQLNELELRLAEIEQGRRQLGVDTQRELTRLEERIAEDESVDVRHEFDRVEARISELETAARTAGATAGWVATQAAGLSTRVAEVETAVRAATNDSRSTRKQVERLNEDLYVTPHTADDSPISIAVNPSSGRLGFVGGGGGASPTIDFQRIFRGSEDFVRERQQPYIALLRGKEPVLDVGCGRGEFLGLLKAERIRASGVDADQTMVEHCKRSGLRVRQADALSYLASQKDHSLGSIFSAHFIEHVTWPKLSQFLALSLQKLRPDGLFIAETINPYSIRNLITFWADPSHERPILPEALLALTWIAGFDSAEVFFPCGHDAFDRDRIEEPEFAVVARKARSARTSSNS